jgi:hypothetical protein
MAWVDIKTTDYNGAYDDEGVVIKLQYNDSESTPEKLVLRFYATSTSSNGMNYYVLWKPSKGGSGEKLRRIKAANAKATTNTTTITLTKSYTAKSFAIPEYWLLHTGAMTPWQNESDNNRWYITYYNASTGSNQKIPLWKFFENETDWWENSRRNFKTVVSSFSYSATTGNGLLATAVTATAPTITDNGNNTYTITAAKGKAGTNNAVKSSTLYYKLEGNASYTTNTTFSGISNLAITAAASAASQKAYAYTKVDGTYNDVTTSTTSLAIKNYQAPSKPGTPVISYSKNRLTIKENWKYSWSAATATNSSSPIKGYRLYLYKNGSFIPITDSTGAVLSSQSSSSYYYDKNITSITIYPDKCGFAAGDKVKFAVRAYTTNGKGAQVFSDPVYSVESVVQNAGVVHVRNGGAWAEGQVKVRVNGQWVEAQSVKVYSNGQWVEAK